MATNLNAGLNNGLNPGLRQSISGGVDSLGLFRSASLDLRFADKKTLTDRVSGTNLITFSRASSGTYVGSDGLIKTSAVNKLLYSNEFTNAAWNKTQLTLVSSTETAPDGTATATTFSAPNTAVIFQDANSVIGGSYINSIWIKGSANATVGLRKPGMSNTGIGSDGSVAINVTTEWQKFTAVATSAENTDGRLLIDFRSSNGASVPSGFEVSLWHAQTEEGTTATDYIPTGATIGNAPRFDHDPVTGESLGLLIEEEGTNLVANSKTPTMVPVGGNPPSISTVSNQVLPSGEIGSVKFVVYGSGDSRARLAVSGSFTGNYRGSIYWKLKNGGTWTRINRGASNTGSFLYTDFALGNLGIPDGSEVYFTFAQTELGSFPTSYIPTSGSAVTRSPDIATIEGTNFSSWYNQSEGTVFVELGSEQGGVPARFQLSDDSGVNRIQSRKNQLYCFNGTQQFNLSYTSSLKEASAVSGTSTSVAASGSVVATHGSASLPTCTNMELGKRGGNFDYLNGHIARLAYFPVRKTDQELIDLTKS